MPLRVVQHSNQTPKQIRVNFLGQKTLGIEHFHSNPPEITLADFEDGKLNFSKQFTHRSGGLSAPDRYVDRDSLRAMMEENQGQMLAVYHGLNGKKLEYGFRSIGLSGEDLVPPLMGTYGLPSHHLTGNGDVVKVEDTAYNWTTLQDLYFDSMRVSRTRVRDPKELNRDHDPKCIIFPWQTEVELMYETNRTYIGTAKLYLANFSNDHEEDRTAPRGYQGPNGYRHGICFYAMDGIQPMLINHYVSTYHYRGTDLGFLCPPRCSKITDEGTE